tara:strand:+ start:1691 stop:3097 length:1407 start_codon:yes stop_codon:yes gene_type:complete
MDKNTIINGNCLDVLKDVSLFPNESIDLIVTSPPYADKRGKNYPTIPSKEYVKWFLKLSKELKRVLKSRGSFILNIKEHVKDFERQTYTYELVLALKEQGWLWIEEYCWYKKTSFPGKWKVRFRDNWERCYHFAKQKDLKFYHSSVEKPIGDWAKIRFKDGIIKDIDKNKYKSKTGSGFSRKVENWSEKDTVHPHNVLEFNEIDTPLIKLASVTSNVNHSAAFPIELPGWFMKLLTRKNDIVLDPFMGSGSTALAAIEHNRNYIGIEIEQDFIDVANTRIVMDSIFKTRKALTEKNLNTLASIENRSCVYAFFLKSSSSLKKFSKSRKLLYLGITNRGLAVRELEEHLKDGKTPNSSFRRSIGAILKKKLKLEVLPRTLKNPKYDKYRFTKDSESKLTDWIKKNCVIGYWASVRNLSKKELMDLETALTVHYEPTLNLAPKTIKHNKQARHLTSLRKVCSDEWRKKIK